MRGISCNESVLCVEGRRGIRETCHADICKGGSGKSVRRVFVEFFFYLHKKYYHAQQ